MKRMVHPVFERGSIFLDGDRLDKCPAILVALDTRPLSALRFVNLIAHSVAPSRQRAEDGALHRSDTSLAVEHRQKHLDSLQCLTVLS